MKFNTAYSRKPHKGFATVGETRTVQYEKDKCDINNILKKYQATGLIDHVSRYNGDYSDLGGVQDYHSSLNQVLEAQNAFDSLPSSIRNKFSNDPGQFLAFVSDANNMDEMVELGLAKKKVSEKSEKIEAADKIKKSADSEKGA